MSATKVHRNPAKAAQAAQDRQDEIAAGSEPVRPWRPRKAFVVVALFEVLFAWMIFAGASMGVADTNQTGETFDGLGSLLGGLVMVAAISPAVIGAAFLRYGSRLLFWVTLIAGTFDLAWMLQTGFLVHL